MDIGTGALTAIVKQEMVKILIVLLVLSSACGRIKNKTDQLVGRAKEKIISELKEPVISKVGLFEKFPELKDRKFKIDFKQGVKCTYFPSFYTFYFVYSGDKAEVLDYIAHIPCTFFEIKPDTVCRRVNRVDLEKDFSRLTDKERRMTEFYYRYRHFDASDLEFFECIKTPEHHTVIVDTKTGLIYHRIDYFRE